MQLKNIGNLGSWQLFCVVPGVKRRFAFVLNFLLDLFFRNSIDWFPKEADKAVAVFLIATPIIVLVGNLTSRWVASGGSDALCDKVEPASELPAADDT